MEELSLGMAHLRIDSDAESNTCTVALGGELDISAADAVHAVIARELPRGAHVVFDLSGLRFMDSSGIAMMLAIVDQTASVRLRRPSPIVRRIIESTGLTGILVMDP